MHLHARRLAALWVALLTLIVASALGIGVALGQSEDAPSPARGQASVIAQGVTALPVGEIGWRVRLAAAATASDQTDRDVPGFILVDQGSLLVNDLDAERQARLATGEAVFLPAPTSHQEAPLGTAPVSYYRIELVAGSDVGAAGNDQLVFIGEPFTSPGGTRDLDLVREVLDADESVELELEGYAAPALLLVTAGAVELVPAANPDAAPVRLPAGQGAGLGGNVIARAADGAEATFITAIVGPEVLLDLAQRTAPTNEGTVALAVYICPGTPGDPSVDCTVGDASGVVIDGPVVLTTDAASAVPVQTDGASWLWGEQGGLLFGTYFLQPGGIAVPEGYELSEVRGSVGASGNGWTFVVDEANPNAILNVIYIPAAAPPDDADSDGDGLSDAQEAALGTDPTNPDTDEDGLFDVAEVAAGTDPTLYDTDGDGFGDNEEAVNGSDPLDPASVPAGEPTIDTDGDMLTDAQEAELGTNPELADSDGDGLTDFAEVGFEPGSATGTDPNLFDTDGDGVGDGEEVANGTDPTDPTSA